MRFLRTALEEVGMKIDQGKTQFVSVGEQLIPRVRKDFDKLEDDDNDGDNDDNKLKQIYKNTELRFLGF